MIPTIFIVLGAIIVGFILFQLGAAWGRRVPTEWGPDCDPYGREDRIDGCDCDPTLPDDDEALDRLMRDLGFRPVPDLGRKSTFANVPAPLFEVKGPSVEYTPSTPKQIRVALVPVPPHAH